jgi:hypothetical protein
MTERLSRAFLQLKSRLCIKSPFFHLRGILPYADARQARGGGSLGQGAVQQSARAQRERARDVALRSSDHPAKGGPPARGPAAGLSRVMRRPLGQGGNIGGLQACRGTRLQVDERDGRHDVLPRRRLGTCEVGPSGSARGSRRPAAGLGRVMRRPLGVRGNTGERGGCGIQVVHSPTQGEWQTRMKCHLVRTRRISPEGVGFDAALP